MPASAEAESPPLLEKSGCSHFFDKLRPDFKSPGAVCAAWFGQPTASLAVISFMSSQRERCWPMKKSS